VVSDPYNLAVLPVHVCVLAELQLKSELFYCSHQLVQAYPDRAVAWFSVGVYYLLTGKPEAARRFFAKAVSLDPAFAAAWVGVGHCFSAQDDNEQALTAYRSATRLFPTSHLPLLFIGMEYLRTSSLSLADQFLRRAEALCPGDPLVLHEHAVVHYRSGDYAEAARLFRAALACLSRAALPQWEATAFNLGHALRKLRRYDEALRSYEVARRIDARNPTVHTAIGLVHHVRGDLARAVECYHVALAVDARDTVTSELMTAALRVQFLGERPAPVGAGASAM
jgi:anaphase-promoting complex subunit 6